MNIDSKPHEILYVGIDGGGSKCKARIVNAEGVVLGQAIAGPANPLHGLEIAKNSIVNAAEQALIDANLNKNMISELVAGVGLAGVNLPTLFKKMSEWQHPFKKMFLTTDLHIACLGAHSGNEGAVIVAGTGSCGYSFVKGQSVIYGAHGFPFGDKGSGAWIGLEAVRAALLAFDGLGPDTQLNRVIAEEFNVEGLSIVEEMSGSAPCRYAKLAPKVIDAAENGDEVAAKIIAEGANYLSRVAEKLLENSPDRLSLLGGLSVRLIPWLSEKVQQNISEPLDQPEAGAVCYAKQEYGFWEKVV